MAEVGRATISRHDGKTVQQTRSPSKLRKILWILFCISLVAWAIKQCYQIVKDYNAHPIQITRSIGEDSVAEFPAVTVCNLNPLPKTENLDNHDAWGTFLSLEKQTYLPDCHWSVTPTDSETSENTNTNNRSRFTDTSFRRTGESDTNTDYSKHSAAPPPKAQATSNGATGSQGGSGIRAKREQDQPNSRHRTLASNDWLNTGGNEQFHSRMSSTDWFNTGGSRPAYAWAPVSLRRCSNYLIVEGKENVPWAAVSRERFWQLRTLLISWSDLGCLLIDRTFS
ncbi:uncharacterized protein [Macrobrachium rosenbergii]|uniref:uncharacterized protein n=1 Tax=Macrobrachium rosenbergii TaxID=79674 RepID=UPI0034D4C92A